MNHSNINVDASFYKINVLSYRVFVLNYGFFVLKLFFGNVDFHNSGNNFIIALCIVQNNAVYACFIRQLYDVRIGNWLIILGFCFFKNRMAYKTKNYSLLSKCNTGKVFIMNQDERLEYV